MNLSDANSRELLRQLGAGQPIAAACEAAGLPVAQFQQWWTAQCRRRVPAESGSESIRVRRGVRVDFDRWGIPYVYAADDGDLFHALGYLTARDRLFQIDYLRRKATGRLAEVLGPDAVSSDVTYRTIELSQAAERQWTAMAEETRTLLSAYCDGVNDWLAAPSTELPIEFDLLDYRPEPWRPQDSLAILGEFRWYLTGRLQVIVIPELLKRRLGDGALYQATLVGEAGDESIVWPGDYAADASGSRLNGPVGFGGSDGPGSNNWALAASRSRTGHAIMSGDPHLVFAALPLWFEARLKGDTFDVAGVSLAGMPGMIIGRTPRVAWTITNNICSQRDLYQEQTRDGETPAFLYDGNWEPATLRRETIAVRGGAPVEKAVLHSRHGPIVDDILPAAARDTGPVSLKWVGHDACDWPTALVQMNRADSAAALCEATRPWLCPTFNVLSADVDGHIAMQTTGRIPLRPVRVEGYRAGWEPAHQWSGLADFEQMPRVVDPPRGFLVTANNRTAPDDYPLPLANTSTSGHRARRIRQEIERQGQMSIADCQRLQRDFLSLRALECVEPSLAHLSASSDARVGKAAAHLRAWDGRVLQSSVAPTIFHAFFTWWSRAVAAERIVDEPPGSANASSTGSGTSSGGAPSPALLAAWNAPAALLATERLNGLAAQLLARDPHGWFHRNKREQAILAAFHAALDELTARLGPDVDQWQWGRIHVLVQPHPLSGRGDLGSLFDQSGRPLDGDGTTVCNMTPNAQMAAYLGPGYRSIVDLGDHELGTWAIDAASASALCGSPHYGDQLDAWDRGEYRYVSLAADRAAAEAASTLSLVPATQRGA